MGLWTCDYIPKNPDDWAAGPYDRSCPDEKTEYTVGEFNCSCVGISKFQAVCGGEQTLADVSDEDYFDACELTDVMGCGRECTSLPGEAQHGCAVPVTLRVTVRTGQGESLSRG